MTANLIVIGLSVLLWVATEFFFPIKSKNQLAINQKHFWSIMLFIFSLFLGFSIKGTYETQKEIKNVATVFQELSNPEMEKEFQSIFTLYHRHFDHAQPVLNGWALQSLGKLREDMSQGYISLPRELASQEIGKVYPYARETIVATNVGSTEFYFGDRNYIDNNVEARDRQIPVVRFYLYKQNQTIKKHNGAQVKNFNEFIAEVKELHNKLGSVYSIAINLDNVSLQARDLLLLDNKFVAETELAENWEPIRARATENKKNLNNTREYFIRLTSLKEIQPFRMSNEDVKKYFHKYEGVQLNEGESLAEKVFDDIMLQIKKNRY